MIYFITNRVHNVNSPSITIVNNFDKLHEYLKDKKVIGLDKEFNGLNEIYNIPLLTIFGDDIHQFVIDDTSVSLSELKRYEDRTILGHNIKIDIKTARKQGLDFRILYDTMIAEQRFGLGSNRGNSLVETYQRRTGKPFPESKDLRDEFTQMSSNSILENKHILYGASDIRTLFEIKEVQKRYIEKFDYHHLLYNVEFPLIPILADAELEGFELNEELWKKNIKHNKDEVLRLEREMDAELNKLGVFNYRTERQTQEIRQISMFPDLIEDKVDTNLNKGRISYSSSAQILLIFDKLGIPRPTSEKKEKNKITGVKERSTINSIGEEALQSYVLEHPKTPLKHFISLLLEHKSASKNISSFGERFVKTQFITKGKVRKLGYKNSYTGKIHTIYRQCMSETGRLQSGDEKNGFYNSQQIPATIKDKVAIYRVPFTLSKEEIEDDWWITTSDLTGAEAVIMCAFAKDEQLYEWAVKNDDLHSPMATTCYKALYNYRLAKKKSLIIRDSYNKEYTLSEDFIIDKNNNKQLRTDFKTITFGVIYGASPKTVALALNIPLDEGKVIVETIKKTIPKTFEMVEAHAQSAIINGYVIHNKRTNSRHYFMSAFKEIIPSDEAVMIQQKARNSIIQGTQADLLKEAMVEIDKEFRKRGIPNCLLLQVHDELVWKHKGKEAGELIPLIMGNIASKYLEGFTVMKAEAETLHTWTK